MNEPSNDARTLALLRRRDPAAVERWFLEHTDALYTFAFYRVGKNADLAGDVVQETFLVALRKIRDYDPHRGEMFTWLTFTARNCIRKILARRGRVALATDIWDRVDEGLIEAYRTIDASPLPDEVLERRETSELVQMTLSNLPDRYRRAIERHYCHRQSLQEIARDDGTSESAVKSLLHRARLAFQAAFRTLADAMGDCNPARETQR